MAERRKSFNEKAEIALDDLEGQIEELHAKGGPYAETAQALEVLIASANDPELDLVAQRKFKEKAISLYETGGDFLTGAVDPNRELYLRPGSGMSEVLTPGFTGKPSSGRGVMGLDYRPTGKTAAGGEMGYPRTGEALKAQQSADELGMLALGMQAPRLAHWILRGLPARQVAKVPGLRWLKSIVPTQPEYQEMARRGGAVSSAFRRPWGQRTPGRQLPYSAAATFGNIGALPAIAGVSERLREAELAGDPNLKTIAIFEGIAEVLGTQSAQRLLQGGFRASKYALEMIANKAGTRATNDQVRQVAKEVAEELAQTEAEIQSAIKPTPTATSIEEADPTVTGFGISGTAPIAKTPELPPTAQEIKAAAAKTEAEELAAKQAEAKRIRTENSLAQAKATQARLAGQPSATGTTTRRQPTTTQQTKEVARPAAQPATEPDPTPVTSTPTAPVLTEAQQAEAYKNEELLESIGFTDEEAIPLAAAAARRDPDALKVIQEALETHANDPTNVAKRQELGKKAAAFFEEADTPTQPATRVDDVEDVEDVGDIPLFGEPLDLPPSETTVVTPSRQTPEMRERLARRAAEQRKRGAAQQTVVEELGSTPLARAEDAVADKHMGKPLTPESEQYIRDTLKRGKVSPKNIDRAVKRLTNAIERGDPAKEKAARQQLRNRLKKIAAETPEPQATTTPPVQTTPPAGTPSAPTRVGDVLEQEEGVPTTGTLEDILNKEFPKDAADDVTEDLFESTATPTPPPGAASATTPSLTQSKRVLWDELAKKFERLSLENFNRWHAKYEAGDPEAVKFYEDSKNLPDWETLRATKPDAQNPLAPGTAERSNVRLLDAYRDADGKLPTRRTPEGQALYQEFVEATPDLTSRQRETIWKTSRKTGARGERAQLELEQYLGVHRDPDLGQRPGPPQTAVGTKRPVHEMIVDPEAQGDVLRRQAAGYGDEAKAAAEGETVEPPTTSSYRSVESGAPRGVHTARQVDPVQGRAAQMAQFGGEPDAEIVAQARSMYGDEAIDQFYKSVQKLRAEGDPDKAKKRFVDWYSKTGSKALIHKEFANEKQFGRWLKQILRQKGTNLEILDKAEESVRNRLAKAFSEVREQPYAGQTWQIGELGKRAGRIREGKTPMATPPGQPEYPTKIFEGQDDEQIQMAVNSFMHGEPVRNAAGEVLHVAPKNPVAQAMYRMEVTRMIMMEKLVALEGAFKGHLPEAEYQRLFRATDQGKPSLQKTEIQIQDFMEHYNALNKDLENQLRRWANAASVAPRSVAGTGGEVTYRAGRRGGADFTEVSPTGGTGALVADFAHSTGKPITRAPEVPGAPGGKGQPTAHHKLRVVEPKSGYTPHGQFPRTLAEMEQRLTAYSNEVTSLNEDVSKATNGIFQLYAGVDPTMMKALLGTAEGRAIAGKVAGAGVGGVMGAQGGREFAEQSGYDETGQTLAGLAGFGMGATVGGYTPRIMQGIVRQGPGPFKRRWTENVRDGILFNLLSSPTSIAKAFLGSHAGGHLEGLSRQAQGISMRFKARQLLDSGDREAAAAMMTEADTLVKQGKSINNELFTLETSFATDPDNMIKQVFRIDPSTPEGLKKLEELTTAAGWGTVDDSLAVERLSNMVSGNWLGRGFRAADWPVAQILTKHGVSLDDARRLALTGTPETAAGQWAMKIQGTEMQGLRAAQTKLLQDARALGARIETPEDLMKLEDVTDPEIHRLGVEMRKLQDQVGGMAGWKDVGKTIFAPIARVGIQAGEQGIRWGVAPFVRGAEAATGRRFSGDLFNTLAPRDKPFQTGVRGALATGALGAGTGSALYLDPRTQDMGQAAAGPLMLPYTVGQGLGTAIRSGKGFLEGLGEVGKSTMDVVQPLNTGFLEADPTQVMSGGARMASPAYLRKFWGGFDPAPGRRLTTGAAADQAFTEGRQEGVASSLMRGPGGSLARPLLTGMTPYGAKWFPSEPLAASPITGRQKLPTRMAPWNVANMPESLGGEGYQMQPVSPGGEPQFAAQQHAEADRLLKRGEHAPNALYAPLDLVRNIVQKGFFPPNATLRSTGAGADQIAQDMGGGRELIPGVPGGQPSLRIASDRIRAEGEGSTGPLMRDVDPGVRDVARVQRSTPQHLQYQALKNDMRDSPLRWQAAQQDPTGNILRGILEELGVGTAEAVKTFNELQAYDLAELARSRGASRVNRRLTSVP